MQNFLSKIHLTKFSKIIFLIALVLVVSFGTFEVTSIYFHRQFQIFYSLDKRENDQEIIKLINSSNKYVYFAIYTFTKDNIADALVAAKKRGVEVWGITDATEAAMDYEKPILEKLQENGITVETQKHPDGIMHIKAIVTDKAYALGSYNWTESATTVNDEILEVGTDKQLHDRYFEIIKNLLIANSQTAPNSQTGSNAQTTANPETNPTNNSGSNKNSNVYDYTEAPKHIGEYASVKGMVAQVYKSNKGTIFFDFCQSYKGCPFSAVIFASSAGSFSNLSQYQGKQVTVTGKISSYQGTAEIILDNPDQISQ